MRYSAIVLAIIVGAITTISLYRNATSDSVEDGVQSGTIVQKLVHRGGQFSSGVATHAALVRTRKGHIVPVKDLSATLNKCWKLHTIDFKGQPSTLGGVEYIYVEGSCRPS